MCGPKSPPPVPPSFTDPVNGMTFGSSDALNTEIQQRIADAKAKSDSDKTTADLKAANDETTFQNSKIAAQRTADINMQDYFKSQGVDPTGYEPDIQAAINTVSQGIKDLDPAPMGSFAPTMGATLFNQLLTGKQNQASNQLHSIFGQNYVNNALPTTAIDPITSDLVSEQFDPLASQLDNAFKRGTLNQTGYDAALKQMSGDKTRAMSTVSSLGQGVLAKDRSDLSNYVSGALSDAGNTTLNSNFDPTVYSSGAQDLIGRDMTNLKGSVSDAIGKTAFSDITSLLNAGGAVQGANDPTATNPGAAGAAGKGGGVNPDFIAQQIMAQQQRGLGSQGAF